MIVHADTVSLGKQVGIVVASVRVLDQRVEREDVNGGLPHGMWNREIHWPRGETSYQPAAEVQSYAVSDTLPVDGLGAGDQLSQVGRDLDHRRFWRGNSEMRSQPRGDQFSHQARLGGIGSTAKLHDIF